MVDPSAIYYSPEQRIAKDWLARNYMPFVLVNSSPTAMSKMAQNNLKPAEFLRPFGFVNDLGGLSIPPTVDKNDPIKPHKFRVNFVDQSTMSMSAQGDNRMGKRLDDLLFKESKPLLQHAQHEVGRHVAKELIDARMGKNRRMTEQDQTPWFSKWKQNFLAMNRF
jgi:hypothetical protein